MEKRTLRGNLSSKKTLEISCIQTDMQKKTIMNSCDTHFRLTGFNILK
jgi:hypothetical protein